MNFSSSNSNFHAQGSFPGNENVHLPSTQQLIESHGIYIYNIYVYIYIYNIYIYPDKWWLSLGNWWLPAGFGVYERCTPISDKLTLRMFDGYFILHLLCCLDFEYLCCDSLVEQSRGGSDSYLGGSLYVFPVWWFHTHSSFIFVCNIYNMYNWL